MGSEGARWKSRGQSDADLKMLCEDLHKPQELDPRRKEGARASGGSDHLYGRNLRREFPVVSLHEGMANPVVRG